MFRFGTGNAIRNDARWKKLYWKQSLFRILRRHLGKDLQEGWLQLSYQRVEGQKIRRRGSGNWRMEWDGISTNKACMCLYVVDFRKLGYPTYFSYYFGLKFTISFY